MFFRRLRMGVWMALAMWLSACGAEPSKEITFVYLTNNPATIEQYWKDTIADFESKNPNVKVNLLMPTFTDGPKKIEELVKAGKPPALARVSTRSLPAYVAQGLVEPMDDYMTAEFKAQFAPALVNEGAQYQGRTFGLPIAVTVRGFYYNKDLLQRAGVTAAPKTWDELRDAAVKVSRLSNDVAGFGIQGKGNETSTYFYYFLWGNGGDVLSNDGTRATFNSPRGVEALNFMLSLIDAKAAPADPTKSERTDLENDFVKGKYGMIIAPNRLSARLEKEATFPYEVASVPFRTTPTTLAVEDTLILFKQADHKDVAWKFVEFIYQDSYRVDFALREGFIPEKTTIANDPKISGNAATTFFVRQLSVARFEPLNTKSQDIANILGKELAEAYRKTKAAKAALDAAAKQINSQLDYSATAW